MVESIRLDHAGLLPRRAGFSGAIPTLSCDWGVFKDKIIVEDRDLELADQPAGGSEARQPGSDAARQPGLGGSGRREPSPTSERPSEQRSVASSATDNSDSPGGQDV